MRVAAKKINKTDCYYLTEGKAYDAIHVRTGYFEITDDEGDILWTSFKGCNHIDGNWTIIGNPAVAVKSEEVLTSFINLIGE